ncbi:MAG: 50S ribosomal protein L11 methyltransferase [Chitinophagaceae bacterium]
MTKYIEIIIATADAAQKDLLIAQLSEAGVEGFEEDRNLLKAFIKEGMYDTLKPDEIIQQYGLEYSTNIIEERNWNAEWEAGFTPVVVTDFCAIRAAFHAPMPGVKHEIIITPKMSFGTGHHATTYMMVQAMQQIDLADKTVFDFGTGTGVLAILAEKCGAASIKAIDNDDWSITNAVENIAANNCHKIALSKASEIAGNEQYEVILANINRNIILEHMSSIKQHLAINGVVLLSGLLTGDEAIIAASAQKQELSIKHRFEMNGWICLLVVNT